jgi:hypothetical protein
VGREHQPCREAGKQSTTENQTLRKIKHDPVSVPEKGILLIFAETTIIRKKQRQNGARTAESFFGIHLDFSRVLEVGQGKLENHADWMRCSSASDYRLKLEKGENMPSLFYDSSPDWSDPIGQAKSMHAGRCFIERIERSCQLHTPASSLQDSSFSCTLANKSHRKICYRLRGCGRP